MGLGILAMSTAAIFIRYAQTEAGSLVIAAYRLGIASLILVPIAIIRYRKEISSLSKKELLLGLLSGIFLAIHFAAWISSLEYTSVASSLVLVWTSPLWVAILAPITIKEPITKTVGIGMLISFMGTMFIGLSDVCLLAGKLSCPPISDFISGKAFIGDMLALVGAWMGAGYLLIGRNLRAKLSLISYISVVYGMAAIILILLAFGTNQHFTGYSSKTYLLFLILALVPQLFGHTTVNWALEYLSAAYVSIILLCEPIGSIILAYLFLNEIPTPIKLFGAILIFGGVITASYDRPGSKLAQT